MTDAEMVRAAATECMGWTFTPHGTLGIRPYVRALSKEALSEPDEVWVYWLGEAAREWNPLIIEADCWQLVDRPLPDFERKMFIGHLRVEAHKALGEKEPAMYLDWLFSLPPEVRRKTLVQCRLRACGVQA